MLRELSDVLAEPLCSIYNTSLQTCQLPDVWKEANISAIFKKGDRKLPSNYRPVSLTSIPCKLMEGVVRDRLIDHMTTNNLLSKQQFGFIKGRTTSLQLLHVLEHWQTTIDRGGELDVVYFDFRKAFDTVPHRRLLSKLRGYGITGNTLEWIEHFLIGRRQRVQVKGKPSRWHQVKSGIPQGSVLGPTLFVIYINDLPDTVLSLLYLFADDTKLYREIESPADELALQDDLSRMSQWSALWLLEFHPDKCKSMSVSTRGRRIPESSYKLEATELQHAESEYWWTRPWTSKHTSRPSSTRLTG